MNTKEFIDQKIVEIQKQVGNGKLVCALSGGVDSSVCAVLVNKAVGDQLTCIFVDHGLMRKDEPEEVVETFIETFGMKLIHIDARKRFLEKLAGVSSPEQKRKIIGEEFIRVFEEEAKKLGKVDFLVQGTIYPDIVESGTEKDGKIEFIIEYKPTGETEIQVKMIDKLDYPVLQVMMDLKTAIRNLIKNGQLPKP